MLGWKNIRISALQKGLFTELKLITEMHFLQVIIGHTWCLASSISMALGSELTGRCVSRVVCVWVSQACSSDKACWNWPRASRAASSLCCGRRKTVKYTQFYRIPTKRKGRNRRAETKNKFQILNVKMCFHHLSLGDFIPQVFPQVS